MKLNLNALIKSANLTLRKHGPEILTFVGVVGMIGTTVAAVKVTPAALGKIDERKKELKKDTLSKTETVKAVWKCYAPVVAMGCASTVCVIGANHMNLKRNAALAAAYTLTDQTLREYRDKVVETIGERKEQTVRDEVAKEAIIKDPLSDHNVIPTEYGNTLCYDRVSGRYFRSDINAIRKAECEINRQLRNDMYVSLNEFYYELGLPEIDLGDILGWNVDQDFLNLQFSSQLANDGTPCLVLNYNYIGPRNGY